MRKAWVLLWGGLVLVASGCAVVPKSTEHAQLELTQALVLKEYAWSLSGRLALKRNHVAESVRIKWQHKSSPSSERLAVYGPLGRQWVVIKLVGDSVVVDYGTGREKTVSSLTEGLDLGLGFDVPIVAFRYWVLGLPAPGSQFVYEPDGFIQRGWRILFSKITRVDQYRLPKKIQMSYGDIKLKLLVDQWQLF
jgi:outer membrane lipoprotein LolB